MFLFCGCVKRFNCCSGPRVQVEEQVEVEVAEGYTVTQFCDKIIDIFLNEKPRVKEWRRYLVFREEWKKYRDCFYNRCRNRADAESDPTVKEKLVSMGRKVKKVWKFSILFCWFYVWLILSFVFELFWELKEEHIWKLCLFLFLKPL